MASGEGPQARFTNGGNPGSVQTPALIPLSPLSPALSSRSLGLACVLFSEQQLRTVE